MRRRLQQVPKLLNPKFDLGRVDLKLDVIKTHGDANAKHNGR